MMDHKNAPIEELFAAQALISATLLNILIDKGILTEHEALERMQAASSTAATTAGMLAASMVDMMAEAVRNRDSQGSAPKPS